MLNQRQVRNQKNILLIIMFYKKLLVYLVPLLCSFFVKEVYYHKVKEMVTLREEGGTCNESTQGSSEGLAVIYFLTRVVVKRVFGLKQFIMLHVCASCPFPHVCCISL